MARINLLKKIIFFVVIIQFGSLVFLYSLVPNIQTNPNTLQPSTESTSTSTSEVISTTEVAPTKANVSVSTTVDDKYPVRYTPDQEKEINEIIKQSNDKKFKGNNEEALNILDLGLVKYPYSDLLYTYKGGVFFDQQNWGEAEKYYKKAFEYNPKSVWHASNIAIVLGQQQKKKEAIKYQKIAYELEPNAQRLFSLYWDEWGVNDYHNYKNHFELLMKGMREMIKEGQYPPPEPFHALHFPFTASELLYISRSRAEGLKNRHIGELKKIYSVYNRTITKERRIKVGYVSFDFRGHAVGIAFQDVFKYHNKEEFEIFAYNVCVEKKTPYKHDSIYQWMKREVEHFKDLEEMPLQEAADLIYKDGVDILVDIGLYTSGSRMDIFLARPAPVQVAGIGLAVTTGAPWIDYMIADNFVVPAETMQFYEEKLLFVPWSYHPFSHKNYYGLKEPATRESVKLPKDKFLYCNHQGSERLTPDAIDAWAEILKQVENSALVVKGFNTERVDNIRKELKMRGVKVFEDTNHPENQLYTTTNAPKDEHIPQKAQCNIFLDTHYYNGHSTTGDMLWAGVPIVTFPFVSMAGRAAGSFALSMGFPEMITNSWEEYINRAVELGKNPDKYDGLRRKVEKARMTSPLFDMPRWVKNLETGYKEMFANFIGGNKPKHIVVTE